MGNDRIQPGTKREQATTLESGSGYYLSRIVQRLGGSIRQEANKYGTAKSWRMAKFCYEARWSKGTSGRILEWKVIGYIGWLIKMYH